MMKPRAQEATGRGLARPRGPIVALGAVVVGLAVLAAGCGGASTNGVAQIGSTQATTTSSSSSSGSPSDRRGVLVAFSACMRKHGLPNFPDPKAVNGGYRLTIGSENGLDPNTPRFKNAQQVCKKLLPNGGTPSPQEQAKQLQKALKYASCIRAHGMPDYPDPKAMSDGGIEMGEAPDSPQFKTAEKACRQLLPQ